MNAICLFPLTEELEDSASSFYRLHSVGIFLVWKGHAICFA